MTEVKFARPPDRVSDLRFRYRHSVPVEMALLVHFTVCFMRCFLKKDWKQKRGS